MNLSDAMYAFCKAKKYAEAWNCVKIEWETHKDYRLVQGFRAEMRKVVTKNTLEYYKASYDLTAREIFDDFMLALEWNRPAEEQFWLPRREKLMPICEALQDLEDGRMNELFLSQPPRTGKSTLILFFTMWVMLRNSEKANLYISYTDAVVSAYYNGVLELLSDPLTYRWKELFPNSSVASTNAKDNLLNLDRKKRYASLTARSLYGTLNGSCDCNGYLILDDVHSGIEEAMNRLLLDKAWMRITNNAIPRAKETAKILWIGTRWSLYDAIARRIELLESDDKYKEWVFRIFNLPALNEHGLSNFDYDYGVGFSTEHYERIRAMFENSDDLPSWDAQYMGQPIERSGTVFDPSDFEYYNGILPDGDPDRVFVVVDPAWGGGDYVAAPAIYDYGDKWYVHQVVFNNGDKKITQPKIAKLAIDNNAGMMWVEATRATSSYAEGVDTLLKNKGHRLNMTTTVKHWGGTGGQKGKAQRIFAAAPDIKERMVFRDTNCRDKEYTAFMNNVFAFTVESNKHKHEDAPDVLAMAVLFGGSQAKAEVYRRPF